MNLLNNTYPWHERSWQRFLQAQQSEHLPHALLLSGEQATGKAGFAQRIIKALLCESPITSPSDQSGQGACHQCQSCKTYESGANPDYLQVDLLEDKQQISVDQIRAMNAFLGLTRSYKGQRVVWISSADRMNLNAANSLLKSLEEPSDNSVIILTSSKASSLLPTIKSRCQIISLATPGKSQALNWLRVKVEHEKDAKPATDELLLEALDLANGKPLTAFNILTKDSEIIENRASLLNDLSEIIQEHVSITDIAKKWQKEDREQMLNWQLGWIQQLIKSAYVASPVKQANEAGSGSKSERLLKILSENIVSSDQWILHKQLLQQKQLIHTSVNPLIFLENMLVLWLNAKHCN